MKSLLSLALFVTTLISCGKNLENSKTTNSSDTFVAEQSIGLESDRKDLFSAIRSNQFFFVKHTLRAFESLSFQFEENGETPLTEAIKSSRVDIIVELLRKGNIVNLENQFSEIPLILILKSMRMDRYTKRDLILNLLSKDVDINKKGINGFTAIKTAIEEKQENIAKLLIIRVANISESYNDGTDLLSLADESGFETLSSLMSKAKEKSTINVENVSRAIEKADLEILKFYNHKGSQLKTLIDKQNLLIEVLKVKNKKERLKLLKFLLSTVKVSASGNPTASVSPLIFAAKQKESSHKNSISKLIQFEVDLYTTDVNGMTALDVAARKLNRDSLEKIYERLVTLNPDTYLTPGSKTSRVIISACYNVPRKKEAKKIKNGKYLRQKILSTMRCPN